MSKDVTNATTDLAVVNEEAVLNLFGGNTSIPTVLIFDEKKVVSVKEVINLASGENVSISDILNKEIKLQGMGAVKQEYVNEDTGEFGNYVRYILFTDQGSFTTTSTFIGRTLKMLYQTTPEGGRKEAIKVIFKQKEKDGKRKFIMELL